ncbi:hypothetical protein [Aromatoleum evansii]|uniref:hypothetical protein n=1 Tax=Aromatoleum evansii TaxID=59406 RepID=UPI00145DFEFB|nr:hypothetical protein [Aromatoleum evansii]NMG28759.1 hypothetical protein [Aromatoleum evansii]
MGIPPEPSDTCRSELPEGSPAAPPKGSRRRFIGATAGGVGVLLAVQAKSALAGTCLSPSAMVSGNLSRPGDTQNCIGGLSPADWKLQDQQGQMVNAWPSVYVAPTFSTALADQTSCNGGHDITNPKEVFALGPSGPLMGTLVSEVFSGAPPDTGIWEVLAFPHLFDSPSGEFMSHLLAALFNALTIPGYPVKTWHVFEMWEALKGGANSLYCPSSLVCNPDSGLRQEDVIAYLSSTYDVKSGLLAVCTVNGNSLSSVGKVGGGKVNP